MNIYLRQIVRDLLESGELPPQERKYSIYGPSQVGSFKFLMLRRAVPLMSELSRTDEIILNLKSPSAARRARSSSGTDWTPRRSLWSRHRWSSPARTKTKSASAGEMNQKGEMPRYLSFFTAASG